MTIDAIGQEIKPGDICLVFARGGKSTLVVAEIIKPKTINGIKSSGLIVISEEQALSHRVENYANVFVWKTDDDGQQRRVKEIPQERKERIVDSAITKSRDLKEKFGIQD